MISSETRTANAGASAPGSRAGNGASQNGGNYSKLVNGLGWFSVGLGVAEALTPGLVARLIGIENDTKNRAVLRGYGLRELTAGIGILTNLRPAGWLWGRVAGDAVDLASLASAFGSRDNDRGRLGIATAAVAGVTALDVVCARHLSANGNQNGASASAVKSVVVDCSPDEAYRYWHDFQNLPRFMTYLESVETTNDRRSHWTAKGPGGITVEWDAETVRDEPGKAIAWRSVGGTFPNTGSVTFELAPGGRGTLVTASMNVAPYGGAVGSAIGKVLGLDLGRRIQHDLRNFKQVMEVGEVTQSDSSVHSGMHAAQPAEMQAV